jgi:hypothetical protein
VYTELLTAIKSIIINIKEPMDTEKKIIEEGIAVAKNFLQKLINPPLEELGLLIADNIKLWRFKNQVKILTKAEEYINKKNIKIKQIPLKILVPLLDGASLEEDDDLRDKWSALIVNYANENQKINCTIYPNILNQLSSNEARCLDKMLEKGTYDVGEFSDLWNEFELNWGNVDNLKRLGLLEAKSDIYASEPEYDEDGTFRQEIYEEGDNEYRLTSLAKEFIKTCKLENKSS